MDPRRIGSIDVSARESGLPPQNKRRSRSAPPHRGSAGTMEPRRETLAGPRPPLCEGRVGHHTEGGEDEDEHQQERREGAQQVVLEVVRLRGHRSRLLSGPSSATVRSPVASTIGRRLRGATGRPSRNPTNDRPPGPWTDDDPHAAPTLPPICQSAPCHDATLPKRITK